MHWAPNTQRARALFPLVLPALVIGAGSSLALLAVSKASDRLQDVMWTRLPDALDVSGTSSAWIIAMLTLTGFVVGLVVWRVPGHAGPDPATQSMVAPPLAVLALPGLVLVVVVGLAGGVSLGPENPITALNIALAFVLGPRVVRSVTAPQWVMLAAAGTIGALFGTPIAAALVLSEAMVGVDSTPLWDRLFAPLVAAGAGAFTTTVLAQPSFSVSVAPYRGAHYIDLVSAPIIAVCATLVGVGAAALFPFVHSRFHSLRHPVVMLTAGGAVLGVIGAIGGRITLFKGLSEMKELASGAAGYSSGRLALIAAAKLVALLVAASCGFRGGRIFPGVFVGVAVGLLAHSLIAGIPPALSVSCAVLGLVLAMTHDGWLALLMAAIVVPDTNLLPILCIALLPAWLVVTAAPEMLIRVPAPAPA